MVNSSILPEPEKSLYRLSGEGFSFLLAGTETTAVGNTQFAQRRKNKIFANPLEQATLTVIAFYLLAQPDTLAKLQAALQGVDPAKPTWTDLEQRPYLWAVIHEALRMMPGVSHRSARIAREEDLVYTTADQKMRWVIPRGTPIGMTSMINHYNEDLFQQPAKYLPERWLLAHGQPNHALEKNLISFGRGTRNCVGQQYVFLWNPPPYDLVD